MKLIRTFFLAVIIPLTTLCVTTFAQTGGRGFNPDNVDRSIEACTDFNRFANGTWLAKNQIPAEYSSWSNWHVLLENNNDILRKILEEAKGKNAASGSNTQKIGDYYASCMDETKIEADDAKPLEPFFAAIKAIGNTQDLLRQAARLHKSGVSAMFVFGSTPDKKNNTQVIGYLGQGGLGLPNRDYYLEQTDKSKETRGKYLEFAAKMFELSGESAESANAKAATVMAVETKLAEAAMDKVTLRDPNATYNKMTADQVRQSTPNLDWKIYFRERGVDNLNEINVAQPEFFKALDKNISAVALEDWKTYLRWQVIRQAANELSSKFDTASFDFYGRYLNGTKQQQSRWKRCVAATDGALGEALGEEFVKVAYPPKAKARMNEMIDNLMLVLQREIPAMNWMSEPTKREALAKLSAFKRKIGYPDKWRDYSKVKIGRDSYFANAVRIAEFESQRSLDKLGKPVDKSEWLMTVPEVNAYYHSFNVEIVFPAGILRPPFFDFEADDALNYGAIGGVIGHEIIHGFDDSGRKYDARGNLRDWWQPEDAKNYEQRASCVEKQFSAFKVFDDLNVNGKLVLGESVADLGGLRLAYEAYKKSLEGKPKPATIDGFTPEQRFFLGWAQVWAFNSRPEYERFLTQVDEHPLGRFRINGPLSNMPEFHQAFGCKLGDAMMRAEKERCRVW